MATDTFPLGAVQGSREQMPSSSQAQTPKMLVHGLPRWIVARQVAPSAASTHDVVDSLKDAAQWMGAASASCREGREVALDTDPFYISQVAGIARVHASQRTASGHLSDLQNTLMEGGAVKRGGKGRPRVRPERVVGDKGYSSRSVRRFLQRRGIRAVIPRKRNERLWSPFDRELYRERNRVERCINKLKQFRRVATRYEKLAANYLALVTLAAAMLWL
jgi:transposase